MWIVEVNVAGRRITYEVRAPRFFGLRPRHYTWRPATLRNPRAA